LTWANDIYSFPVSTWVKRKLRKPLTMT
jgi:hypothetical protein